MAASDASDSWKKIIAECMMLDAIQIAKLAIGLTGARAITPIRTKHAANAVAILVAWIRSGFSCESASSSDTAATTVPN